MSAKDIVLTGMGARFPESNNTEEFWKNLVEGVDMVTDKEDRWPNGVLILVII